MTTDDRDIRDKLREILTQDNAASSAAARLCMSCSELLPVSGAAISVAGERGARGTICVSDSVMEIVEELQFTTGVGPCVDAMIEGGPVLVPEMDAAAAARWPAFTPDAHAAGVRAIFGFPLP